ncbi:MAG: hypothetical protein K2M82_03180 [Lachnospiraceae bacterium]|nr:hypothetical protein [Lachnospiraceae bacterium]
MKKKLIIFLIILLVIVLSLLIMLGLAFQDDNTDKYNTPPSDEFLQTAGLTAIQNNELYVSEAELNGFIAYSIQQSKSLGLQQSDIKLNAGYVEINKTTPSRIYLQIDFKGKYLGLSADLNTSVSAENQTIVFTLENCKIGRLPIPNSAVEKIMSRIPIASLNQFLSIDGRSVTLPMNYSYEITQIGVSVDIQIMDVQVNDGSFYIKTNPIAQDFLNSIKDALAGTLGEKVNEFAQGAKDIISNWLDNINE